MKPSLSVPSNPPTNQQHAAATTPKSQTEQGLHWRALCDARGQNDTVDGLFKIQAGVCRKRPRGGFVFGDGAPEAGCARAGDQEEQGGRRRGGGARGGEGSDSGGALIGAREGVGLYFIEGVCAGGRFGCVVESAALRCVFSLCIVSFCLGVCCLLAFFVTNASGPCQEFAIVLR